MRPFSEGAGEISVGIPRPGDLDADVCGLASDPMAEQRAHERARDLACAAEMGEEPAWAVAARERSRRRAEEERDRELRQRTEAQKKLEASMRASGERIARLMGQGGDRSYAGFADPEAADGEAEARARAEAAQRTAMETMLATIRGELGRWTTDSAKRLDEEVPATSEQVGDAKRLGRKGWALTRLGMRGSDRDLAYAAEQVRLEVGNAVFGAWVLEAMGERVGGKPRRQLFTVKARRKLFRSYVLWRCGSYGPLSEFAGSTSSRRVRGVKRCPQRLLARVLAVGSVPWSRATTTRDASEAHKAWLWRRTRLPVDVAPEEERAGPSGQVVSRYTMDLPRAQVPRKRDKHTARVREVLEPAVAAETAVECIARHALRFAVTTVAVIGLGFDARAAAPPA